jgi:hypothetical protein
MAIPQGYRRLENSECRPAPDARHIGQENLEKTLSVTIRLKQATAEADRDRVAAFARAQGLRVYSTSIANEIVVFGPVHRINVAFAIELRIYAWGTRIFRGCEGFLHLPEAIADLVAEVIGLIEHETGAGGPWTGPFPSGGAKPPGGISPDPNKPVRIIADWTVPHPGPSGPVNPGNYALVSSFDIDWLNTAGFQTMLDNLAASPGAFKTVRVMKALSSGTAELGSIVTNLAPPDDAVWAYAAKPAPPGPISFSATISALTELTKRGLTPFVVLGFFPDGVYSGTTGGLPAKTPFSDVDDAYQNSPYGPDSGYLTNPANAADWGIILGNWNTLIQAFFQALKTTFGEAIEDWWFEVWNEPDSPFFWIPDTQSSNAPGIDWPASAQPPLYYYCQLYQETVEAISAASLGFPVKVGGPAIMANTYGLSLTTQTDLQVALPIFLNFVTAPPPPSVGPLQCDFISLHAKGDWLGYQLPVLTDVIDTVESAVSQFTSLAAYGGYFDNKPIVNDEGDMRVLAGVSFYPRMTSQFPSWLTALMIANDSLTSEYASKGGAQFVFGSDNAHLELVGWQQLTPEASGAIGGNNGFGQQRSIMTAASAWTAGTASSPAIPQDLVKVPVYNFYELLRLLGDQHGVFISGQQNFYPTDPNSDLFSAITVGAPSGELTHVCWVFCVYPTDVPNVAPKALPTPQDWSTYVEVIGLPASWAASGINWVQFQIGPAAKNDPDDNSFTVAQTGQPEAVPPAPVTETDGAWQYDISKAPAQVSLSNPPFNAGNVRMAQELGLVQYMQAVAAPGGVWKSPAPVDFEPYSATAFWITPFDTTPPATPVQASYTLPDGTIDPIPVALQVGTNVLIRWQYPTTDPIYNSFFYFEVSRNVLNDEGGIRSTTIITPQPQQTTDGIALNRAGVPIRSFALRAAMWVDTTPTPGSYSYSIVVFSASGIKSGALTSLSVMI